MWDKQTQTTLPTIKQTSEFCRHWPGNPGQNLWCTCRLDQLSATPLSNRSWPIQLVWRSKNRRLERICWLLYLHEMAKVSSSLPVWAHCCPAVILLLSSGVVKGISPGMASQITHKEFNGPGTDPPQCGPERLSEWREPWIRGESFSQHKAKLPEVKSSCKACL